MNLTFIEAEIEITEIIPAIIEVMTEAEDPELHQDLQVKINTYVSVAGKLVIWPKIDLRRMLLQTKWKTEKKTE